jgi:2,3-bisphosphoglycerate-dependent phosphoglycerate mutase
MPCFAVIRHGAYEQLPNVPSALQPFALTVEGAQEVRQQAQVFAQWLEENDIKLDPLVDSSTLLRAWQTASIYVETLRDYFDGTPQIESYSALCERSVGAVANLTIDEIERVLALDPRFSAPPKGWKSDSHYCLPFDGAESLWQAGQRVAEHIQAWQRRVQHQDDQRLKLFIGHGASIRHGMCQLEVLTFDDIKRLSMFYGHPVVFDIAPQSPIKRRFGEWKQRHTLDVPD